MTPGTLFKLKPRARTTWLVFSLSGGEIRAVQTDSEVGKLLIKFCKANDRHTCKEPPMTYGDVERHATRFYPANQELFEVGHIDQKAEVQP